MTKVVKIIALSKMFFFNEVFPRLKENDTRTCQTDPLVLWLHIVREKKTKHPVAERSHSRESQLSTGVRRLKPNRANLPDFRTTQKASETQGSALMGHLHFTLLASTPVCLRGSLVRRSPAGWRRKTLQTEPLEITLQNPKSNQSNLKNGLFYLEQSITTWNGMKVFVF